MAIARARVARGFTLIELLVVIAVIALLIGMLLPSMGKARGSARTVKCLSQLRSLGQFTAMYADANKDAMPRSQHSAFPNQVAPWGYAFFEFITQSAYTESDARWLAVFNGPYRCPHDRRKERWSYGYNVYYELTAGETLGRTWTRYTQIPGPGACVLFGELVPTDVADHAMAHFWVQFNAPPEIDSQRHGDTTGLLYVDGHAVSKPFSSVFDRSTNLDCFNPATAR